ncbi:Putative glycosyltransferase EpsE [Pontiella desulfatans]|uniref:Glycosyltransferase EpsE n=1 Tax=Pontiella desulfatans TaxID=2750659 RepID=A0A6C2TYJ7_PONDE|nr:glycosyltransferase [Pontiella desulfatans]VGO12722.1 Putative glycosyltransferase EpsE [Pontiella desulfatans]
MEGSPAGNSSLFFQLKTLFREEAENIFHYIILPKHPRFGFNACMKVSVVMPVYNAEGTVLQALDCLRAQTYPSLEIVVVNDGSTDGTLELLRRQKEIVLLDHSHRGIAPALNDGLAAAQGEYIARMDADDLCHPERVELQASFLDTFTDMGIVGSKVKFGGDRKKQAGYAAHVDWINSLVDPNAIALNRFVESPFAHPSVMFRRELFERFGAYRDGPFPEDYELWLRWMANGVEAGKVDRELVTWNDPPDRLSRTDERYSIDAFYATKADYLFQWLEKNNPHHPNVIVWGAGRVTRKRVDILSSYGLRITHYVDLKKRKLNCGTPVIQPDEIPDPTTCFVLPMVGKRGARDKIRAFLTERGFVEGQHCIFAA